MKNEHKFCEFIFKMTGLNIAYQILSGETEKISQFRRFDEVQDFGGCVFRNNWKENSSAIAEYARLIQNAYPGNFHNLRGPFRCGCFVCQAGASTNICLNALSRW